MDKISDLLASKNLSEPAEIKIIKDFVVKKYGEMINVRVENNKIVVFANSSALANSVRMDIPAIQRACDTEKRIAIYIATE